MRLIEKHWFASMDELALWRATKEKQRRLFELVLHMEIKDKRRLFNVVRAVSAPSVDTFLPSYGLHCGEFACFHILAEHARKEQRRQVE